VSSADVDARDRMTSRPWSVAESAEAFAADFARKSEDAKRQAFSPDRESGVAPDERAEKVSEALGTVVDPLVDRMSVALDAEIDAVLAGSRPTRAHANAKTDRPARRFDTTALHADVHGGIISHADYMAHNEKWDYVWRSIKMGERILDVGCGTDMPLVRAICCTQAQATKLLYKNGGCYVGVDLNKLKPTAINWAQVIGEVDMTSEEGYNIALMAIPGNAGATFDATAEGDAPELRGYTMIVALEVIEHMGVEDGKRLLENLRDLLSPGGRIVLSTPVYDGKAMARNHVHEYYITELEDLIDEVGLCALKRYGTFTAEPQLKRWLRANRKDWLKLYEEAREFHSAGYMSGVLAPMVPDIARNNLWVLARDEEIVRDAD
jgi:SAM-dependent methyltransferase